MVTDATNHVTIHSATDRQEVLLSNGAVLLSNSAVLINKTSLNISILLGFVHRMW